TCSQSPACIHQRHQILGVFPHRFLEQLERLVQTVETPECAGPLQLGHVHPEAGDDRRRFAWLGKTAGSSAAFLCVLRHWFSSIAFRFKRNCLDSCYQFRTSCQLMARFSFWKRQPCFAQAGNWPVALGHEMEESYSIKPNIYKSYEKK